MMIVELGTHSVRKTSQREDYDSDGIVSIQLF